MGIQEMAILLSGLMDSFSQLTNFSIIYILLGGYGFRY